MAIVFSRLLVYLAFFPLFSRTKYRHFWHGNQGNPLGRIGDELSVADGRRATHLTALNAGAIAKEHLGSLDRVRRVVRLAVSLVTTPEFREHPKVADAASELMVSVFGADKTSTRLVYGMVSLPVGVCVLLESIFQID